MCYLFINVVVKYINKFYINKIWVYIVCSLFGVICNLRYVFVLDL